MPVKLVLVVTTVLSLLILENRFPFFTFQNSLKSRITNNFGLGALNSLVSSLFTLTIAQYIALDRSHVGIVGMISVPIIAGTVSFLVLDLYMYFWHRLMHGLPLAWKFHRIHHLDRSMNVSTAYRFHPIEIISSSIPKLALIWWLGISSSSVLIYELVFTVVIALHHSNFAMPGSIDRLLAYIILTPNYHRIHHSQLVSDTNSNYGSVLIWWDRIFGTYRLRLDVDHIQLGVSDEIRALNIWQSLTLPFAGKNIQHK